MHDQSLEIKGSSCPSFSQLSSLDFFSKDILSDPRIWVLVWLGADDWFDSWDSLSFSFSHYLEDHFSYVIEKTSFVCLSFFFPLKDWFGFLFVAFSLVIGFPYLHHHGVDPFWKVKNIFLSKAFSSLKILKINCWNYWKRTNRELSLLRDLLKLYFKGNCVS